MPFECFSKRAEQLTASPPTAVTRIALHPLVIMNISDHWTRMLASSGAAPSPTGVIGMLLGQVVEGKLVIITSMEAEVDRSCESQVTILEDRAKIHLERLTQVFPAMDVVGWYTTGGMLDARLHTEIHRQMVDIFQNEALTVLLMDPSPSQRNVLPVYLFECVGAAKGQAMAYHLVTYSVEADEVETIGVDAAIHAESQQKGDARRSLCTSATRIADSLSVLKECVDVVIQYLVAVEARSISPDAELMRSIATLSCRLNRCDATSLKAAKDREYMCAMLAVYLGVLAKTHSSVQELIRDTTSLVGSELKRVRMTR